MWVAIFAGCPWDVHIPILRVRVAPDDVDGRPPDVDDAYACIARTMDHGLRDFANIRNVGRYSTQIDVRALSCNPRNSKS